jgi:cysteinyl-tRNA synthetase
MLRIHNTLTHQLEIFVPNNPDLVTIYSCGPTVYSRQHLWNLRAAYFVDLLKNVLKHLCKLPVKHVMNITDVGHLTWDNEGDADHGEDRMEKWARQQGTTAREVAQKFTTIYEEDLRLLRIDPFEVMPKATDHIAEQIAMVQELENTWYTYIIPDDGVYMDTSKIDGSTTSPYGVLMGEKHLAGLEHGARIADSGKRNPTDFALWKFNTTGKKRDMEWESPWWIGFPGWHIECSAMSMKYLGTHIDIHTGGMEHIAVHHTNEIAQSECSHAHVPRVNYRVHYQWLMMNGKKIAKSDGNVAFLNEVIDNGYSPEDMRYFYLQAHYRSFQDFTRDALEEAKRARAGLIKKIAGGLTPTPEQEQEIVETLLDDLNTWWALGKLHSYGCPKWLDDTVFKLNLFAKVEQVPLVVPDEIQLLASQRREAKQAKDFAKADALRKEIESAGWKLLDTPTWRSLEK